MQDQLVGVWVKVADNAVLQMCTDSCCDLLCGKCYFKADKLASRKQLKGANEPSVSLISRAFCLRHILQAWSVNTETKAFQLQASDWFNVTSYIIKRIFISIQNEDNFFWLVKRTWRQSATIDTKKIVNCQTLLCDSQILPLFLSLLDNGVNLHSTISTSDLGTESYFRHDWESIDVPALSTLFQTWVIATSFNSINSVQFNKFSKFNSINVSF